MLPCLVTIHYSNGFQTFFLSHDTLERVKFQGTSNYDDQESFYDLFIIKK